MLVSEGFPATLWLFLFNHHILPTISLELACKFCAFSLVKFIHRAAQWYPGFEQGLWGLL